MRRFNAMACYILVRAGFIVTLLTLWIWYVFGGPKGIRAGSAFYSRYMRLMLKIFCGVGTRVEGLEKLPPGPCIIAAKHQAEWDPFALAELLRPESACMMKKELFEIPLWGFYARNAGSVRVDRAAGAGAMRHMLRGSEDALKKGLAILLFPEGTRTEPGQKDVRYLPGVAALYKHLKVPVAPVALNTGLFWPRSGRPKRPGTIVVRVLDPIEPGLDTKAFMARLHDVIETESMKLFEDAGGADGKGGGAGAGA
ncbi:MAG: lysophospholipid acyltransferase family protein [Rhodospirillales bacterium]